MYFDEYEDDIPGEKPDIVYRYDADVERLSFENDPGSPCSTSESDLSNTFIDDFVNGYYQGWNDEHNRWLGRWVSDSQMKALLYSMQAFRFLDLQTFLVKPMADFKVEDFAKGTRLLDDFLANADYDIVTKNKKFPDGAYHFLDEIKWLKTINGLYHALNHIQQPEADLLRFYDLWIGAIVTAILENLPEKITREKFESNNELSWQTPTFETFGTSSCESDPEELNLSPFPE